VRFEFPYMTTMQATGRRRPPDREPVLRAHWNAVIDALNTFQGDATQEDDITLVVIKLL